MRLGGRFPTFAVITCRAGSNKVVPGMVSALVSGGDVVDGQLGGFVSAILTSVVVPAEDFRFCQFEDRARPLDHVCKPDD